MTDSFKIGSKLYALLDKQLGGFLTWSEKNTVAIFLFTNGQLAERYADMVHPNRPLVVYQIDSRKSKEFVAQMLNSDVQYALINVPPEHADVFNVYEDEVIRNYAIVDLRQVRAKMM